MRPPVVRSLATVIVVGIRPKFGMKLATSYGLNSNRNWSGIRPKTESGWIPTRSQLEFGHCRPCPRTTRRGVRRVGEKYCAFSPSVNRTTSRARLRAWWTAEIQSHTNTQEASAQEINSVSFIQVTNGQRTIIYNYIYFNNLKSKRKHVILIFRKFSYVAELIAEKNVSFNYETLANPRTSLTIKSLIILLIDA